MQLSFEQSIERSDVIIIGTAQSVLNEFNGKLAWELSDVVYVTGDVSDDRAVVFTPSSGPACGYGFEPQREYLVFASMYDEGITTSLCDGNLLTSELTEPQILYLSQLQVSNAGFRDLDDVTADTGEGMCGKDELEINGCISLNLVIALILLVVAVPVGLVVIKKRF